MNKITPEHNATETDSVAEHLKIFEVLDFDVYSNQKWDRLSESHAEDILVTYPDGHQSKGIKAHIEELRWLVAAERPCAGAIDRRRSSSSRRIFLKRAVLCRLHTA